MLLERCMDFKWNILWKSSQSSYTVRLYIAIYKDTVLWPLLTPIYLYSYRMAFGVGLQQHHTHNLRSAVIMSTFGIGIQNISQQYRYVSSVSRNNLQYFRNRVILCACKHNKCEAFLHSAFWILLRETGLHNIYEDSTANLYNVHWWMTLFQMKSNLKKGTFYFLHRGCAH